ncbi:MAG: zinc-ribbon domain-containing protein, partial [Clostridia bacterium]|nr:zinc-ribbon domain-containing protein [Clostridia bacterium]
MKCHNCKNEIRDDANFCLHCGTPVLKKEPDTRPMINEFADEKIVIPVVQNEAVRRTPVEPEAAVEETESYTVPAEDTLAESAEAVKLEVPPVIISNSLQVSEEPVKDTSPVIETIPQDEAVCDIPKQVNREDISVGDVPFVTGNEPYAGGVSNRPATEKTEYATYMPPPNPALEEKLAKGAKKRAKLAAKEAKEREKLEAKAAKLRAKFEAKEAKRRAKASKKKHTGLVVFLIILILLLLSSIAVGAWFVHDRGIIDLEEMFPWMPEIPDFPEIGFLIGVLEDEAEEPDEDETEDEDEETDDPDETEEENEPIEKDEKVTYCDAVTDGAFALVDSKSEV